MIYFWIGIVGVVAVIKGLIMYEFQEHLLGLNDPEQKTVFWKGL